MMLNLCARRLAGAAVAAVLSSACTLDAQSVGATGGFERTLSVGTEPEVFVTTGSGRIVVRTGDPGTVRVVAEIRAPNRVLSFDSMSPANRIRAIEANPPVVTRGNVVRIGEIADRDLRRNISISYELTVPYNTHLESESGSGDQTIGSVSGPVRVSTGSGTIRVGEVGGQAVISTGSGDIELMGAGGGLDARTGSGTIRAENIAGTIRARTGSGRVRVAQTASGAVAVSTGSGSIVIEGAQGPLRASTGSGDIVAQGALSGDWLLKSSSGSVRLDLPSNAAFDLHARTGSGSIETEHPIEVLGRLSRRELQGRVRGGGSRLEVSTSSGSIRID